MILQVSADAPAYVRIGAAALLVLHIGGGLVGLLSGTTALLSKKGERLHRVAGNVFFVSMMIMAAVGACVAPFLPEPSMVNVIAGTVTFYLVLTSWMTVRRKDGRIGAFEYGAFAVILTALAADLILAWQAGHSPTGAIGREPPQSYYAIGVPAAFAVASDFKVILRGGISGAQRIARHLWRMCVALFIAAGSLFLGQAQLFPKFHNRIFVLAAPEIAVLLLLIFWMYRVRLTKWFKNGAVTA